jgi:type I restriction-modification system DNA methylase subunit
MDYSTLSKSLTQNISKINKKNEGIYFTPPSFIQHNLDLLDPYINQCVSVLEPSCGSGEYITALNKKFPNLQITGIEFNKTIYDSLIENGTLYNVTLHNVTLHNKDFLTYELHTKYDLIIGNPPFFVMKKDAIKKIYESKPDSTDYKFIKSKTAYTSEYYDGRANIFVLFLVKSLQLLNENGILSFILPKNFLNCLYYDKLRKYIFTHFQILHMVDCKEKFIDTDQDTILLILRKQMTIIDNSKFTFNINTFVIFSNTLPELKKFYENSTSLSELGFNATIGTVVWNEKKSILTDDNTKTRLIYSSDIVNNQLTMIQYKNGEKKNYIDKKGISTPMIVLNRGYGKGAYKFNCCLLKPDFKFLVENHLICIQHIKPYDEVIQSYTKLMDSFQDERTSKFIQMYFGNNAININELMTVLPIYV